MADERFTRQQTTSSSASGRSTSQAPASYAVERARVLFGSYRRGDANDPDAYVAAIAAVLSTFDSELIREVTDPRTGISTTEKFCSFMPNAGELKRYCEDLAARRARLERLGSLDVPTRAQVFLPPRQPQPGDRANVFVPADNKHYPKLLEWSKSADPLLFKFEHRPGIWVNYDIWEKRQSATRPRAHADDPKPLQLSPEAQKAIREADENRGYSLTPPAEETAA